MFNFLHGQVLEPIQNFYNSLQYFKRSSLTKEDNLHAFISEILDYTNYSPFNFPLKSVSVEIVSCTVEFLFVIACVKNRILFGAKIDLRVT